MSYSLSDTNAGMSILLGNLLGVPKTGDLRSKSTRHQDRYEENVRYADQVKIHIAYFTTLKYATKSLQISCCFELCKNTNEYI